MLRAIGCILIVFAAATLVFGQPPPIPISPGKKSGHFPISCVSGENPGPVAGLGAPRIVLRELGRFHDDPNEPR
jgi:hypothetical protein